MSEQLYVEIWKWYLSDILSLIESGGGEKQLDENKFHTVGNRQSYGFRLDILNSSVPEKKGSAVARDLKIVLDGSKEFKKISKNKTLVIKMGKYFKINITVNE